MLSRSIIAPSAPEQTPARAVCEKDGSPAVRRENSGEAGVDVMKEVHCSSVSFRSTICRCISLYWASVVRRFRSIRGGQEPTHQERRYLDHKPAYRDLDARNRREQTAPEVCRALPTPVPPKQSDDGVLDLVEGW
jgi:hypothetical protein